MYNANTNKTKQSKKSGVVILMTGKVDVMIKNIIRDKERFSIMIKGLKSFRRSNNP